MGLRLGLDGYAFAQVRALPELDKDKKTASITFFVDPKSRAYVRHINFNGTDNVNDEVLRREMRQMEGGYLSNNSRRSIAGPAAAAAVHREGRARDDSGAGQPRPRGRRLQDQGRSAGPVRRQPRLLRHLWRDARRQLHHTRISWAPATGSRSTSRAASTRKSTTRATRTRIAPSTACRASCRCRTSTARSSRPRPRNFRPRRLPSASAGVT